MSTLKTNTSTIQSLIEQINALPDAGSDSGKVAVETCTVVLATYDFGDGSSILSGYSASKYVDGQVIVEYICPGTYSGSSYVTIENVICGSCISVWMTIDVADNLTYVTTDGDAEILALDSGKKNAILRVSTTSVTDNFYLRHD